MNDRYTTKQIDRLIQSWLTVPDVAATKRTLDEAKEFLRSIEGCGDAFEECGSRADEYVAARNYGTSWTRNWVACLEVSVP
jgi:hypothetical protein